MKIVYFLDLPSGPHSGVGEKVLAQTDVWVRLGHDVLIVVITPIQHLDAWESVTDKGLIKVISYRSTINRIIGRIRSSLFIWHLSKSENILLYLRLSLMTPDQIALLTKVPYCLEVNSNVRIEYKLRKLNLVYQIYRLSEQKILQSASGVFFVTQELYNIYCEQFSLQNAEFITNGAKLLPRSTDSKQFAFDLVFLATEVLPWHGFDKILQLADDNRSLSILILTKNSLPREKSLKLENFENVKHLHSFSSTKIEDMIEMCVAGISFSALDKLGLSESAALKTRFYLSRGLPVVSNCKDTAFELDSELFLILNDTKSYLERKKLQDFISYWRLKRVTANQLESIDVDILEKQRLFFLSSQLNRGNK